MNGDPRRAPSGWKRPTVLRVVQALVLFGLWLTFSGHLEIEFLAIGAVTAVGAAALTNFLFHGPQEGRFRPAPDSVVWLAASFLRFIAYVPWISYQIIVSNLHVVYLVLHPRMPIYPTLVKFETSLESEYARVLLAQSITLTPGTVTVDAVDGTLLVHCLSERSRQGLASGDTQAKVAWVFDEPKAARVHLHDVVHPEQVRP